uniref:prostaglandin E synthase 3-like isoform X2 n=1 Tax=Myxine glutinosa TaxID=7769 RepID=UPI00358E7847
MDGDGARLAASAKWCDRKDFVFLTFCVEDSRETDIKFENDKMIFSCKGPDKTSYRNEVILYEKIVPQESKHNRTDRKIQCFMKKLKGGMAWPRLTKDKSKVKWLALDFENWKDWEEDSDNDGENFDQFSDDPGTDSDDEKIPDLE